ncbi:MAG: hypothetical protein IME93_04670 [Proteobacteria bacterium]|nr:hypothetical protein [Pseudomonadota bacterium]
MTHSKSMATGDVIASSTAAIGGLGLRVAYKKDFNLTESESQQLMACVCYGFEQSCHVGDAVDIEVEIEQLGDNNYKELWYSNSPVQTGKSGSISYRYNDDVLFGCWRPAVATSNLRSETDKAYKELREFLSTSSHPYLLRAWNYMPLINEEEEGLERYRQFCLGRHDALLRDGEHMEAGLPAASALGSGGRGLVMYFISTRLPGTSVENPRQVSAYRYPEQYGPKSPSFSRAMLAGDSAKSDLFISGTASIKGHETRHAGDVKAQLEETVTNINALIKQGDCGPKEIAGLSLLKIYLRRASDYSQIHELMTEIAPNVPTLYLRADICREDLLLEIEGLYLSSN